MLQEAGASMLVLEAVPRHVGKHVTESVRMVTIGIGAGKDTDGQVLVLYDMLDVFPGKKAKFVAKILWRAKTASLRLWPSTSHRSNRVSFPA